MNRRLLVVDDDPNFLELYQFILCPPAFTAQGNLALAPQFSAFDVVTAANPSDALTLTKSASRGRTPFAGAFVDLHLEEGKLALDVLRKLRRADPNLMLVVVIGQVEGALEEVQGLFREEDADRWDFLAKPFGQAEIRQKALRCVAHAERMARIVASAKRGLADKRPSTMESSLRSVLEEIRDQTLSLAKEGDGGEGGGRNGSGNSSDQYESE